MEQWGRWRSPNQETNKTSKQPRLVWNGWPNNAWTGDGWNYWKFPTRMPTTSHPTTSTPTSHPTTSHPTTAAPSTHPSVPPTIESTSAPSISISPSTHPSPSPSVVPSVHPSISITPSSFPSVTPNASPSSEPSESTSPSIVPSVHPSISSLPSISPSASSEPSVSSFPSISPSTSSRPSISASPSSNPSVSSAPSIAYYAAAQSGKESSVVFKNVTAWPPECTLSEEECKRVFCDGVRNTLQTQLCTNGPGNDYAPCNVGVVCDPKDLGLALGDTSSAVRAVGSYVFPFHITFSVACNDPGCTDQVALATQAADALVLYKAALDSIQREQYYYGLRQALDALETQSSTATAYFSTFTFEYDPSTSTVASPPLIQPIRKDLGDYEFVGVGFCTDIAGTFHAYLGYFSGFTNTQECLLRCKNSACLNSQGLTLRGIVDGSSVCFCLVDSVFPAPNTYYPKCDPTTCTECNDAEGDGTYGGFGTVVNTDGESVFRCFRPKVI